MRITRTHLFSQESAELFKLKLQINVIFTSLQTHDEMEPIKFLSFMQRLMIAYCGVGVTKSVAVRVLSYYLEC